MLQPALIDVIVIRCGFCTSIYVSNKNPCHMRRLNRQSKKKCLSPVQCRHIRGRALHARPRVFVGADCVGLKIGRIALEPLGNDAQLALASEKDKATRSMMSWNTCVVSMSELCLSMERVALSFSKATTNCASLPRVSKAMHPRFKPEQSAPANTRGLACGALPPRFRHFTGERHFLLVFPVDLRM